MKNIFKIILINILVFAGVLIMFELGLRLFWNMSAKKGELYRKSKNRILRYELKPNSRLKMNGYEITINSDGFRDKEYRLRKDSGVYRIEVIGDSVTFAKFVQLEDSLPKKIESRLALDCPRKSFEVLNMGTEGYNSIQELEFLKTKGLKYNPDLVIIYYCFNDPDYPEYYFEKNFINRHSILARYILSKIKKSKIKLDRTKRGIKTEEDAINYFYKTDCWQNAKNALLEIADITKEKGIKMVLLIAPEMSADVKDFRDGYPFWHINDMLENLAGEHDNIVVIDPMREFSRRNLKKEDLTNWYYPNAAANVIIADYALKKLKENKLNLCK